MEKEACQFGEEDINNIKVLTNKKTKIKMNVINFIDYLINPEKLNDLLTKLNVNVESEALIVCVKDSLDINSEISIFDIEDTNGQLVFEKEETKFIELFPLEMVQEMAIEYVNTYEGMLHYEIAQRIIDYRINDA